MVQRSYTTPPVKDISDQGCQSIGCEPARTAASESVASFSLQPRTSIITAGILPVKVSACLSALLQAPFQTHIWMLQ